MTPVGKNSILVLTFSLCLKIFFQHEGDASYVDPPFVLLQSGSALASGLTLRHPLLDLFLGAPKYDPSYKEIIFHW